MGTCGPPPVDRVTAGKNFRRSVIEPVGVLRVARDVVCEQAELFDSWPGEESMIYR